MPTNIIDVCQAMKGCDAVLILLSPLTRGAAISIRKIELPHVLETSIRNVLDGMAEYGVSRILILSSVGVSNSWQYAPWVCEAACQADEFQSNL